MKFELTGEFRSAKKGEWFINTVPMISFGGAMNTLCPAQALRDMAENQKYFILKATEEEF